MRPALGAPLQRPDCRRRAHIGAQADSRRVPRRAVQPEAVHELPAAGLRERLRTFFKRKQLPSPAKSADQAALYVSLAYALSPPPALAAPERSDDLPGGVLEVLDFAPLVREFYRKSGIDERLNSYLHAYQAEGDRLRQPASEMVRATLSYLHTRPITVATQRVRVKSTDKKKNSAALYETVEHERRFFIVPDLLAAPGAVNFRVIADDYYAIVPEGTDPTSSELRRGYLQFVIDPLVLKSNKEIATVLELSANTIAVHRANIMNTLGIHKTAELVVYAIRAGLVNVP